MKRLIIDRAHPHGIVSEMSAKEITEMGKTPMGMPYEQRVVSRIRAVYSVDDELAILRQRESKPEEFAEYFAFAEKIKAEERARENV